MVRLRCAYICVGPYLHTDTDDFQMIGPDSDSELNRLLAMAPITLCLGLTGEKEPPKCHLDDWQEVICSGDRWNLPR